MPVVGVSPLIPAHIPMTRMIKKAGEYDLAVCPGNKEYGFIWAKRNLCHSSIQWNNRAFMRECEYCPIKLG